ncbi:hypothetical protein DMN91_005002 [Ooceraea biroi]|uniref:Uncharacterized protein n=1 Tax=Ooceraea biroi TaxID=2015173 RepID=A0A3L8DQM6_OOCBI|nr:hypothetical protein DMN91_005002 [Ooceraea biroi]
MNGYDQVHLVLEKRLRSLERRSTSSGVVWEDPRRPETVPTRKPSHKEGPRESNHQLYRDYPAVSKEEIKPAPRTRTPEHIVASFRVPDKGMASRRPEAAEQERDTRQGDPGVSNLAPAARQTAEPTIAATAEVEDRDLEIQQQERYGRIERSRWNRCYRELRTLDIPRYLKKAGKEGRMIRIARFRLGNEMREG